MTTEAELKLIKIVEDQARQISNLISTLKALTDVVTEHQELIDRLTNIVKNA